uniref:TIGR00304 family membrane protein n=1 Tax=Methanolobus sp. WCC4 TaxID=3125784 RepID=UPI004046A729
MRQQDFLKSGFILIFLGFIFVIMGMVSSSFSGSGDFGGVILIGPIPIAFGSSPEITSSMFWAGALIAVIYLLVRRRL